MKEFERFLKGGEFKSFLLPVPHARIIYLLSWILKKKRGSGSWVLNVYRIFLNKKSKEERKRVCMCV